MNPGEGQLGEMTSTAPSRGHYLTSIGTEQSKPYRDAPMQPMSDQYHSSDEDPFELFTSLPSLPDTVNLHVPSLSLEEYIATIGEEAFLANLANPSTSTTHDNANTFPHLPDASSSLNELNSAILASSPLQADLFFVPLTPPYSLYSGTSPLSAMSHHNNFLAPDVDRAADGDEEAFYYGHGYITSQAPYQQTTATLAYQSSAGYTTAHPAYSPVSNPPDWGTMPLYSQASPVPYSTSPPTSSFSTLEPYSTTSTSASGLQVPDHGQPTSGSSRSGSPNPSDLHSYGYPNNDGTWRCKYSGCSSKSVFNRGCDLRKHFNRHTKSLFCRHAGCPQSTEGGFSSKKDRARHEAKHNPVVRCEWEGCNRVFSRVDNMKDHVRRIHRRPSFGS